MVSATIRSAARRWVRRSLGALVVLLLLIGACLAFLVGTGPGGRLALSIARGFLPDDVQLEIGSFSGRLADRFVLRSVHLTLESADLDADRIAVDWRLLGLIGRRAHARAVRVDELNVRLSSPADSAAREGDAQTDSIAVPYDLPLDLSVDSLVVGVANVSLGDTTLASGIEVRASGTPDAYRLTVSGELIFGEDVRADLNLAGSGDLREFDVEALEVRALDGLVAASGPVTWYPEVSWDLAIRADSVHPAPLLPDPEEWSGSVSFAAASGGSVSSAGELALEASVDTVYGTMRGEPLAGRLELRLEDGELALPGVRLSWGPADLDASGRAGADVDLEFDVSVPDLELLLPGVSGRVSARGRVDGPRDAPRIRATFAADDVRLDEEAAVDSLRGDVEADLSGPLDARILARGLRISGYEADSARVELSGSREAHRLTVRLNGAAADLNAEASGGLDAGNAWSGSIEALRLSADTAGTWELTDPVAVHASSSDLRLGQACLESVPTRVCVEGQRSEGGTSLTATIDSLPMERLGPLMPEGLSARGVAGANVQFEAGPGRALEGTARIRTSEGSVTRLTGGEPAVLHFAPAEVDLSSGPDGIFGTVRLNVTDSRGSRLLDLSGRVESPVQLAPPVSFAALRPLSAHLDLEVGDLSLLLDDWLPRWNAEGRFTARMELEVDGDGRLVGDLQAITDGLTLRNTVRGQGWQLAVQPARFDASIGPEGLSGELDVAVQLPGERPLAAATGRIRVPNLSSLTVVPEDQPVEGEVQIRIEDLGVLEAFSLDVSEAGGELSIDTQIGGTLAALTVDGSATVADGWAIIPILGLEIREVEFLAEGRHDGRVRVSGSARSGDGTLTISGQSERYPSAENPTLFQVRGDRFQVIDIPQVDVIATPSLDLQFDGSAVSVTGEVLLPRGRLGFPEVPESAVVPSEDEVVVGDTVSPLREPPVQLSADVRVVLGDDVVFSGFGFSSHLRGEVSISQRPASEPTGRGEVRFLNGTYRALGQELRIDPGRLVFSGPVGNPGVEARAYVRASDGTEAGFRIGGTLENLDVTTYSVPPKTDSEVISYILFGRPMSETSGSESSQASNAAAVLGANMLAMGLAPSLGLDEARIDTGSSQNKAQLVVGKYLSPKLYIGYGVGLYEPISTLRLRYLLTSRWSIEAITGDQQSTDLLWRIETGGPKPAEDAGDAAVKVVPDREGAR